MRAAKKDKRHYQFTEIIQILRNKHSMPINAVDTHKIEGMGDMLIGVGTNLSTAVNNKMKPNHMTRDGINLLVEIKTTGKDSITDRESQFISTWHGNHCLVDNFYSVLFYLKILAGTNTKLHEWLDIMTFIYLEEIEPNLEEIE